jgi:glycosyltransferase involved in cell wall biosynthesis
VLWVISEVYFPEETSTGHYMTRIAEGLAARRAVKVICGLPNYSKRGIKVAPREQRNGVEIFRAWTTTLDKNRALCRGINLLTVTASIFGTALRRIRRGDVVLVGTNPPSLPFVIAFACWLRRAECVLKVEDLYPDNMIAAGMLAESSLLAKAIDLPHRALYARVGAICVLGRDMGARIARKAPVAASRITWVPNWADTSEVTPQQRRDNALLAQLGISERFVVGYAGNIGPLQGVKALLLCAERLRDERGVHFLFVGSGKLADWLAAAAGELLLENVSVVGQRPRSEQQGFLNACDVGIVSLIAGMKGVGVPSRTYNMLAAGKPILAFLEADSEIGAMVKEEMIGWVVEPDDIDGFVNAVLQAKRDPTALAEMGRRARRIAETKYSYAAVLQQYEQLLA